LTGLLRLARCALLVCSALIALALLTESVLEARDAKRFIQGQTFAQVGEARVRYLRLGPAHSGTTVVFLSGFAGSIEQAEHLQKAVAAHVPTLAYDRAGYGFSEASTAHTALEQANELAGLLDALGVNQPVVLVCYSASALVARVFADRFSQKTAGMYLIDPAIPELYISMPSRHSARRGLARTIIRQLVASFLGEIRLRQRLDSWNGPSSVVEQRAEAVLARSWHNWAVTREWYVLPDSAQQTLDAPVPNALPFEIAFTKPSVEDETSRTLVQLYAELAARSSRGGLLELEHVDHGQLVSPGPVLDQITDRIVKLARGELR
jgi:pimeloyl-ACP methyl ester carboxylesterase